MRNAAKLALAASGVVITGGAALFAMKRPGKPILGSSYANPLPVASSEAPAKRIPNVAPRLREAWKALGLGDMPEAALELVLANAWLESGVAEVKGGSWWKDRTAVGGGDMRQSGNLGAIQCVASDKGDGEWSCVAYEDSHPDGTKYPTRFRSYSTPDAAAKDFVRVLTKMPPPATRDKARSTDLVAALKRGDVMNYAETLYNRGYYEGFGKTPAERVQAYAKALASHLPAIASALGHDKIAANIGPDLLANSKAKALAGYNVEGTGAVVAVTAAVVGTVAIAAALGAWAIKHQAKKDVESIVDRFKMFVPESQLRDGLAKLAAQGLVVVAPGSAAPAGAIANSATAQAAMAVLGKQAFDAAISQGVQFFGAPASALPAVPAPTPQAAPVRRAATPFKPPRAGKDDAAPGFIGPPAPPPAEEPVNDPANRPDPITNAAQGVADLLQRGASSIKGADIADATSDAILLTALAAEQAEHEPSKLPNVVVDVLSHGASSIANADEVGNGDPKTSSGEPVSREAILSSADHANLSDRGIFVVDSQAVEDIPWPDMKAQMRDGPSVRAEAAKILGQGKLDTAYASGYLFTRQIVPVSTAESRARRLSGAYTPEIGWAAPIEGVGTAILAAATIVSAGASVVSAHAANEARKRAQANDGKPSGIAGEDHERRADCPPLTHCTIGEAYQALHLAGALPRARSIPGSGGHFVWYVEVPAGDVARLSGAGDDAYDAGVSALAQVPFFGLLAPVAAMAKSGIDSATDHDRHGDKKAAAKKAAKKAATAKAALKKKDAQIKAEQQVAVKTEKDLRATESTLKQTRSDLSTAQSQLATARTWVKRHPWIAKVTNPKLAPILDAGTSKSVEVHGTERLAGAVSALGSGVVVSKPAEGPLVTDLGAVSKTGSSAGMLIDAIRGGKYEKARWTHVPFDGMTIEVATDAIRMPVNKSLLRMPISYAESIEAAKLLGGVIVPSARIADAMYAASDRGVFNGLVSSLADSLKMGTVEFSERFNKGLDAQFAGKSGLRLAWKLWILNKRIGEPTPTGPAAINYGGWNPAGPYRCGDVPCAQSVGGTHDWFHSDYSQLFHPVKRYALAADGSKVDLLDYIEQKEGVSREQTQPFRG